MKRIRTALCLILAAALLAGCAFLPSDSEPETPAPTDPLTGLALEWQGQRPVAVAIENSTASTTQWGLSSASVVLEALTEVPTRERWVDGELENSVVTDVTTTVEPTDHVVKTYGAGAPVSPLTGPDGTTNAPASYRKVLTGKATGYYSKSGKGSSGLGLGYGTVAVDPDVIPYGTLLYITSTDGSFVYGYAVATDTGIAVQDGRILVDLFYETYAESVINGAINVNVYVVG